MLAGLRCIGAVDTDPDCKVVGAHGDSVDGWSGLVLKLEALRALSRVGIWFVACGRRRSNWLVMPGWKTRGEQRVLRSRIRKDTSSNLASNYSGSHSPHSKVCHDVVQIPTPTCSKGRTRHDGSTDRLPYLATAAWTLPHSLSAAPFSRIYLDHGSKVPTTGAASGRCTFLVECGD